MSRARRRARQSRKKPADQKLIEQGGSTKDTGKKPPRRPAPVAGNKRQRKTFHSRGSH